MMESGVAHNNTLDNFKLINTKNISGQDTDVPLLLPNSKMTYLSHCWDLGCSSLPNATNLWNPWHGVTASTVPGTMLIAVMFSILSFYNSLNSREKSLPLQPLQW